MLDAWDELGTDAVYLLQVALQTEAEAQHAEIEEDTGGYKQSCNCIQPTTLEGTCMGSDCNDGILVYLHQHIVVASCRQVFYGHLQHVGQMLDGVIVTRTEEHLDGTGPAEQVVCLLVSCNLPVDVTQHLGIQYILRILDDNLLALDVALHT